MLTSYVISLDRSGDRRARVVDALSAAGIAAEIWPATDGASLPASEIARHYDAAANRRLFKRPLSNAEIGCYLSHRRLWSHIADGTREAALVLEDDAAISPKLPGVLAALSERAPTDAILKLDGCKEEQPATVSFAGHSFASERTIAPRTTAYVIGRDAARTLAARGPFFRPVDIDLKHHWEHGVPIFSASPALVWEHVQPSTIEASRQLEKQSAFGRFLANLRYQIRFRMALLTATAPDKGLLLAGEETR